MRVLQGLPALSIDGGISATDPYTVMVQTRLSMQTRQMVACNISSVQCLFVNIYRYNTMHVFQQTAWLVH